MKSIRNHPVILFAMGNEVSRFPRSAFEIDTHNISELKPVHIWLSKKVKILCAERPSMLHRTIRFNARKDTSI
jgi:hypothetical protein